MKPSKKLGLIHGLKGTWRSRRCLGRGRHCFHPVCFVVQGGLTKHRIEFVERRVLPQMDVHFGATKQERGREPRPGMHRGVQCTVRTLGPVQRIGLGRPSWCMGGIGFNRQIQIQQAFAMRPLRRCQAARSTYLAGFVDPPQCGRSSGHCPRPKDRAVPSGRVLGSILAAYNAKARRPKTTPLCRTVFRRSVPSLKTTSGRASAAGLGWMPRFSLPVLPSALGCPQAGSSPHRDLVQALCLHRRTKNCLLMMPWSTPRSMTSPF